MQRISLQDGLELSRIVYGVWRLADCGVPDPAQTRQKIHACLDQGITSFDHADIYGDYRCETLFGEAVKAEPGLVRQLEIITKCDIMLKSASQPLTRVKHYDTSTAHVVSSVDRSLARIGCERIDVLLMHRPDPLMNHDALGECLDGLVHSGKVRAVGVSNFMPWDVELLQSAMKQRLVTNQIELSLLHPAPFTDGQVATAQRLRMPLMAWSPLAGGRLMGPSEPARRVAPVLERLAREHGVDAAAMAVAWLLHHPARVLPVMGTNDPGRVAKLAEATRVQLDRQSWYELYEAALGREVP